MPSSGFRRLMVSRRDFLRNGAVVAGVSALPTLRASQSGTEECKPLPPSIARLKSWKDQATPITIAERQARLEKARELMEANHLAAIMLTSGTSLTYFSGIRWWGGERLFTLILPAKGAAFFVCPAFEEDRAKEQIAQGPLAKAEIKIWQE